VKSSFKNEIERLFLLLLQMPIAVIFIILR